MNGQVEVTWRILQTIAHSIMVHVRVSDKYIHFALMYTTDHLFTVLPIKHLVNQDGEPTMPHKLATGTKPSVSNLRVLFFPCVLQKATAHVYTKALICVIYHKKCFVASLLEPHNIKNVIVHRK